MRGTWLCGLALGLALAAGCNVGTGWNGKYKAKGDPYEAVTTGMTEQEVVSLLGAPQKRTRVEGEAQPGTTVFQLRWLTQSHIITVFIIDGRVAGKNRV